jgi:hypothetical protein
MSASPAMMTFWRAGSRPFQSLDCHITNHSPPMTMKPPANSSSTIVQPRVNSRRGRS